MFFPKRSKLILLFLSLENPFWRQLMPDRTMTQKVLLKEVVRLSPTSITNWKNGTEFSLEKEKEIMESINTYIRNSKSIDESEKNRMQSYLKEISKLIDSNIRVYDFAEHIKLGVERSQIILDEAIYSQMPIFREIYYAEDGRDRQRADQHFEEYQGVYHYYMKRDSVWLRCVLRVRYLLSLRGGITIRCKLNVPKQKEESKIRSYWEYDGFVVARQNSVFWMFEKRQLDRGDYIFFITDRGQPVDGRLTLVGSYLTTGQDEKQSIVSDIAVMCRIEVEDRKRMEHLMHTDATIVRDGDEVAALVALTRTGEAQAR